MIKHIRVVALAIAIAATPACASLPFGETRLENPVTAARTLDQRAYALLHAYAAIVEEATDIVRDPAAPLAFKRALGQAERAATPAAEALGIAVRGYVRAREDFEASSGETQPALQRSATALTIAAHRLNEAIQTAEVPIAELEGLVRSRRPSARRRRRHRCERRRSRQETRRRPRRSRSDGRRGSRRHRRGDGRHAVARARRVVRVPRRLGGGGRRVTALACSWAPVQTSRP